MASRCWSNQNIDLPQNASFIDFSPSNFINPSTLQLNSMILTRVGVFNATDTNYTPNIDRADLVCSWKNNNGLPNTFEGGKILIGVASQTTINTINVFETLQANTWTTTQLQHFDNPSGGQLRHLGNTPREYKFIGGFGLESQSNNVLTLRVTKFDSSTSTFSTVFDQSRQVNSFVGGRDVAFFNININTELDQNDYIELEVSNNSSTQKITAEAGSYFILEQR